MTLIATPISGFARPRRVLAAAALAALALTGCGNDGSGGSGPGGKPDGGAGTAATATGSTREQAAFAALLDKVAQPCATAAGATGEVPTGSAGKQTLGPGESPPTGPIEPGAPTEAQLSDRDRCAGVQHEQRIIRALQAVPEPTPAKVRRTLHSLGYIDERIHGLEQDGKITRFHLDLREKGGRLCEAGTAAGEQSDVTPCVAPATGAFTVGKLPSDGT